MKIEDLLKYLLPEELFECFELTDLQESQEDTLLLQLEEKNLLFS